MIITLAKSHYSIVDTPTLSQKLSTWLKLLAIFLSSLAFAFSPVGVTETILTVTESVLKSVTESVLKTIMAPFLPTCQALA